MTINLGFFGSVMPRRRPGNIGAMFEAEPARTLMRALYFGADGPDVVAPQTVINGTSALSGVGSQNAPAPATVIVSTSTLAGVGSQGYAAPGTVIVGTSTLSGVGSVIGAPSNVNAPQTVIESASQVVATARLVRVKATLIDRLAPPVSQIRAALHLRIGDYPHRVFLCRNEWSGGGPGRGDPRTVRTELGCGVDRKTGLIVPPKIEFTSPLKRPRINPTQRGATVASDVIYLTEVNPTMSERQIVRFAELGPQSEEFIEVEQVGIAGGSATTRPVKRYRIAETPFFMSVKLQWVVPIAPQAEGKPFGSALWLRR